MAKIVMLALFAAMLALQASAASFGGIKDFAGNYYDFTTGQYSSALTGKVYNTAPVAYVPPYASYVASPYVAAPYVYSASYPYAAPAAYLAPAWK